MGSASGSPLSRWPLKLTRLLVPRNAGARGRGQRRLPDPHAKLSGAGLTPATGCCSEMLRARRKRPTATKSATKSAAAAPTHVCSKLGACGQSWSISGFHRERPTAAKTAWSASSPLAFSYSGPLEQAFPLAPRLSRGSRGGYPLAALGSEDWCNPSHGGVFFSFPFFSTAPSLFLCIFPGKPSHFPGSEPSLRLVWAQNQPNRQNTGYFAGIPGKPRVYLENTLRPPGIVPISSILRQILPPDQLSDSGKLASFQNGALNTFSLEISGNAKCWGPTVFLFVCRKSFCRPNCARW